MRVGIGFDVHKLETGKPLILGGVTIPHPRYTTRCFVLEPLAEIAPDVIDPVRSQTISEIFDQARDSSSVERFAPPLF